MRAHNRMRSWRAALTACALVVLAGTDAPASAQSIGYTASVYGTRTTYPATSDRVSSLSVFNSVDVGAGPVQFSVSVPWIRSETTFTGDATALPSFEGTRTGFGDPLIRADLRVVDDRTHDLQVRVAGSVKPALVDPEDGLGTGEVDVAGGGSVSKGFGRTSIFGDLLFWKYGDPEGVDYQDSLSYGAGVARVLGNRWSVMGSLSGFSKGVDGADPPLQANVTLLVLANRHQSLAFSVGAGLTDGAEGVSLATSWRIAR